MLGESPLPGTLLEPEGCFFVNYSTSLKPQAAAGAATPPPFVVLIPGGGGGGGGGGSWLRGRGLRSGARGPSGSTRRRPRDKGPQPRGGRGPELPCAEEIQTAAGLPRPHPATGGAWLGLAEGASGALLLAGARWSGEGEEDEGVIRRRGAAAILCGR